MIYRASKLSVITAISRCPQVLQKVAYAVIVSLPAQVTVGRPLSSLRIISSDLGTLMKEDLLEAVLFLGANNLYSKY